MDNLIWILPVLACPIGMFVMMWMMGKGMRSAGGREADPKQPSLTELRADQQRLSAQTESLERTNGGEAVERDREPA